MLPPVDLLDPLLGFQFGDVFGELANLGSDSVLRLLPERLVREQSTMLKLLSIVRKTPRR